MDRAEHPNEGPRRDQILRTLRDADRPLGVTEVAERLGVHTNTVRFHLEALLSEGAVERETQQPDGRGRPRTVYAPRPGLDRGGARDYELLARILVSRFAADGPDAADRAREAGTAWGRQLVRKPDPFRRPTGDESVEHLIDLLAGLGFAPERGTGQDGTELVRLRRCPFLELAEEYGAVVCPLHLGLMQGALRELDAPVTAAALEPFGEPDACLVRLGPTDTTATKARKATSTTEPGNR